MLTREMIRSGEVRRLVRARYPDTEVLDDAALEASLHETLAGRDLSRGVFVFAYGSLIWNPVVEVAESAVGTLHGYHRSLCVWTELGRGSPERPGLVFALERGGACRSVLLRIAPDRVEEELSLIWLREMATTVYRPRWVRVRTAGGPVSALTFVVNRAHSRYAGRLSDSRIVEALADAEGAIGSAADYVANTVACLRKLEICETRLGALSDRALALRAARLGGNPG